MKKSELVQLIKEVIKESSDTYFNTYSSAVQFARAQAEKRGFEINEDDWFSKVNVGPGRPKPGKTSVSQVGLLKNGKEQRKLLHIQVYNRGTNGNEYELNYYIS